MTRDQITTDYKIGLSGRIESPGKFEGEMLYVPYFWEAYLDGFADTDDGRVLGFKIVPEDRAMFPELSKRKRTIRLIEREDGFVCEV
jgi:hypothetical protein